MVFSAGEGSKMSENQYAPLSPALVKQLTDKLYEKRKAAALEIERQVRDLYASNQLTQLDKLLAVLSELAMAGNPHTRKGGLIGLAAAAIAMGKHASAYARQLLEPALTCFSDTDLRVRYYACESLYNICKICKQGILPHFEQIFDVLWRLSADTDQNVRGGAELLDRLIMDIVVSSDNFDVAHLMSLIREKIYIQVSSNRRFIVSWLNTMLTTPSFSILPYLSEVADGLFKMLGDQQPGVRDVTETVLGQFLAMLRKTPDAISEADKKQLVNVLIAHAHENEPSLSRKLAVIWMDEFVELYKTNFVVYIPSYLTAILPALNNDSLKAKTVNEHLLALVNEKSDVDQQTMDHIIDVLLKHITYEHRDTRLAVLIWIRNLHTAHPAKLFMHMSRIFPVLLTMLSDTSDEVLLLDLQLLSNICQSKSDSYQVDLGSFNLGDDTLKQLDGISPYLIKFTISLLEMFREDPALLNERGVLIIRQLCLLLEPALIYRALCILLEKEANVSFIQGVVSMLHSVLLTATELFILRDRLRELEDKDSISLFECVFRCWCHRPISLLGLCLLSQHYQQAAEIALDLSKVDVTVDILIEIDKLVNLLESPVLAYVRMDMLCAQHQPSLCTVLSALLMLLPQSDAFNTLHKRLQAIPALTTLGDSQQTSKPKLNFKPLFEHFRAALKRRQEEVRRKHREVLMNSIQTMTIN
ncbi:hypothetical protein WR25_19116 [Diploscapter pachys]|uniref:Protein VAC14 homolog n=1 Tax=Diploscapter pachys TaxID=2018661 RepID=A0A2A2L325_9BILA|nr:hypothetical protein WR25_19116 [Diploscapter pachys]